MAENIEPFKVHVDNTVLDDLRERLARTRLAEPFEDPHWEYGMPVDQVRALVEYWRDEYDWRAQEARLNEFDHFRTRIDGQSIHFMHVRAENDDALSLLLMHGLPGSVIEFLD